MKNILTVSVIAFFATTSFAQNIGIGTVTPASKLHLVGNFLQDNGSITMNNPAAIIQLQNAGVSKGFIQLSGDNIRIGTNSGNSGGKVVFRTDGSDRVTIDSTGNMQIIGLQDASLTSNGYLTLGSLTGDNLIFDRNEIMARNNGNPDDLLLQNDGGNVGIGVASPTATLHVNGDLKITDGTQASGRVLTSDANGLASWRTTAYGNNDRIMVKFNGFGTDSLMDGATTAYDNGTMVFGLVNTRFSVNKSGLYHFEGTMMSTVSTSGESYTMMRPKVFMSINNGPAFRLASATSIYSLSELNYFNILGGGPEMTIPFKIDIYLDDNDYVIFKFCDFLSFSGGRSNAPGYISAYLISE